MDNNTKKLYRSRKDRMIAGVCGGLGEYFGLDPLIFRIIFLVMTLGGGFGVLLYIILAIIMPNEPLPAGETDTGKDTLRENVKDFAEEMKHNAQNLATEMKVERERRHSFRNILGAVIVAIGFFLLLGNLFPTGWMRWDIFWPVVIVVLGILIISRKK